MKPRNLLAATTALAAAALAVALLADRADAGNPAAAPLPALLRDTGLYVAGSSSEVRAGNIPFSPQYPLWSDGAGKRRWIHLPPGTAIDASDPDAWVFPRGTKLWKEFSHEARVETRLIERLADGSWRYAAYVWNAQGTDASLASSDGEVVPVPGAPGGRYAIPSQADCVACHEGGVVPVLGFSALQLSRDRDPLAPHAEAARDEHAELASLVARGALRSLPRSLVDTPPRIAAPTPTARAALGYLHANCGHCHNAVGSLASIDLVLAQPAAPKASASTPADALLGRASRFRPHPGGASQRIVPGQAEASVIALRMRTGNPFARMPPLGTQTIDGEGVALVERWIRHDLNPRPEISP